MNYHPPPPLAARVDHFSSQGPLISSIALDPRRLEHDTEDTLIRALDGIDMADFGLFASALLYGTTLEIDGKLHVGLDAIAREFYNPLSLLTTTHFATNIRVTRRSKAYAELSGKVLAQDYSFLANPQAASSPPYVLSASFHRAVLFRPDNQQWRIIKWKIHTVWAAPTVADAPHMPPASDVVPPPSYTA